MGAHPNKFMNNDLDSLAYDIQSVYGDSILRFSDEKVWFQNQFYSGERGYTYVTRVQWFMKSRDGCSFGGG